MASLVTLLNVGCPRRTTVRKEARFLSDTRQQEAYSDEGADGGRNFGGLCYRMLHLCAPVFIANIGGTYSQFAVLERSDALPRIVWPVSIVGAGLSP